MKILDFLKSPKESIRLLNGWQRIWLIFTGLLLLIHVALFFDAIPSALSIYPDTNKYSETIKASEKWLAENKAACEVAELAINQAKQRNEDFNSARRAEINKQRQVYLDKIQSANERLYKIETSGGKYYQEWSSVTNSIDAFEGKLRLLVWTDRKFSIDMVEPMIFKTVINCGAKIEEKELSTKELNEVKEKSKQLLDSFFNEIFWLIFSLFAWAGGVYFLGWAFGWVRDGFKNK